MLVTRSVHRGLGGWLVIILAAILILIGAVLLAGGAWLVALGGSWYYVIAAAGLIACGIAMLLGSIAAVWLYLLTYAFTWAWAVWEVGLNGWPLVPRVVAPT